MLADAENGAEIHASVDVGRQFQVGETPGRAAADAGEHQSAVADGDDALRQLLHGVESASAKIADIVDLGFGEGVELERLEMLPRTDQDAGLGVMKVGAEPTRRAWAGHGIPGFAAIGGLE